MPPSRRTIAFRGPNFSPNILVHAGHEGLPDVQQEPPTREDGTWTSVKFYDNTSRNSESEPYN